MVWRRRERLQSGKASSHTRQRQHNVSHFTCSHPRDDFAYPPVDVSIAPRSACVPAYVDCGRPIASLFCVNPIRANTKSYIARGRVGQTSDDERAQRGRKVHTNAKCDLKDSEVAPYESRTKTVSCTQVTYFALLQSRRTRRFLSSAKGICDSCRLACVPARAIIPKDLNPKVPMYLFGNYDLMVVASGTPSLRVGPKELVSASLVRLR